MSGITLYGVDENDVTKPFLLGKDREAVTSILHGRYTELIRRGTVFLAANQAVQALSLLSATATGLILTNPSGSGKRLAVLHVGVSLASLPAGQSSIYLAANVNTAAAAVVHTTPLIVRNALLGATSVGVGLADREATLPATPVIVRVLGGGPAATVATSVDFPPFIEAHLDGSLMLEPGTTLCLEALTTAISVVASFLWEEIAL